MLELCYWVASDNSRGMSRAQSVHSDSIEDRGTYWDLMGIIILWIVREGV